MLVSLPFSRWLEKETKVGATRIVLLSLKMTSLWHRGNFPPLLFLVDSWPSTPTPWKFYLVWERSLGAKRPWTINRFVLFASRKSWWENFEKGSASRVCVQSTLLYTLLYTTRLFYWPLWHPSCLHEKIWWKERGPRRQRGYARESRGERREGRSEDWSIETMVTLKTFSLNVHRHFKGTFRSF